MEEADDQPSPYRPTIPSDGRRANIRGPLARGTASVRGTLTPVVPVHRNPGVPWKALWLGQQTRPEQEIGGSAHRQTREQGTDGGARKSSQSQLAPSVVGRARS